MGRTGGTTDMTASHLTKLHKPQQVIGYSRLTKPLKRQVIGYHHERDAIYVAKYRLRGLRF
jgi:hypothetical protein